MRAILALTNEVARLTSALAQAEQQLEDDHRDFALASAERRRLLAALQAEIINLKDANDRMARDLAAVDGAFADAGGPVPEAGHPDTYRAAILALAQAEQARETWLRDGPLHGAECPRSADPLADCHCPVHSLAARWKAKYLQSLAESPSREDREQALEAGARRMQTIAGEWVWAIDIAEARRLLQLDPTPTEDTP